MWFAHTEVVCLFPGSVYNRRVILSIVQHNLILCLASRQCSHYLHFVLAACMDHLPATPMASRNPDQKAKMGDYTLPKGGPLVNDCKDHLVLKRIAAFTPFTLSLWFKIPDPQGSGGFGFNVSSSSICYLPRRTSPITPKQ